MKIFVYHNTETGVTSCHTFAIPTSESTFLQVIEADDTNLPLTEDWEGDGIEIGEVFACNDVVSNLIRVA